MKPLIRTFVIALDGLDGIGKSTFMEMLHSRFKMYLDEETVLIKQHFPVYENITGRTIKTFLQDDADLNNPIKVNQMIELQIKNRSEWWCDLQKKIGIEYNNTGDMVNVLILADRYMESNIIYNAFGTNSNMMQQRASHIRDFEFRHPQPAPTIQLFGYCDPKLQMERILSRKEPDRYENKESVKVLNDNFCSYIQWYRNHTPDRTRYYCIPMHWYDDKYIMSEYSEEDIHHAKVLREVVLDFIVYLYAMMTDHAELVKNLDINSQGAIMIAYDLARTYAAYSGTAKDIDDYGPNA
jgi:thymidylate kinase